MREETAAPKLLPREEREVFLADLSRRLWVVGAGRVFWANALSNARPGQIGTVIAAMKAAKSKGAPVARPARPQLAAVTNGRKDTT